jgi:hypothetical protein
MLGWPLQAQLRAGSAVPLLRSGRVSLSLLLSLTLYLFPSVGTTPVNTILYLCEYYTPPFTCLTPSK